MKKIILCVSAFFLLALPISPARAQIYDQGLADGMAAKGIDGIRNVASSVISDSFTPMTHYSEGNGTLTFVPAWFKIRKAYDDPEVSGKDLKGGAAAFGGAYAVSDRLLFYGIVSWLGMEGGLRGKLYGDTFDEINVDAKYNLYSFHAGLGYDLIQGGRWSAPFSAGLFLERYDVRLRFPTVSTFAGSVDMGVKGSGILFGYSVSAAISREFMDRFRVTPYFLFMMSFNRPEMESSAVITPIPGKQTAAFKTGKIMAGMLGLSISYLAGDSLSLSLSAGGLLTSSTGFYNKTFLDGLDMMSIVMAISYSWGRVQPPEKGER